MTKYKHRNKGKIEFYIERGYATDETEAKIFADIFVKNKTLSVKEIVGDEKYHNLRSKNSSLRKEYILKNKNITEKEYTELKQCIGRKGIKPTQLKYWLDKGYSYLNAIKQQSAEQSKRSPRCIEYWINKGYTIDAGLKEISKFQDNNSLFEFIKRYGEKDGIEKYNEWIYTQTINSKRSYLYWINKGYTEKEAKQIVSRLQAEYGKKGLEKCLKYKSSKIENDFADYVKSKISSVKTHVYINGYYPDIIIKNLIIEIYGDFWHMHSSKFKEDEQHPYTKLTAKQQSEKDKLRVDKLKDNGYNVIIIWEHELKENGFQYYLELIKNTLKI